MIVDPINDNNKQVLVNYLRKTDLPSFVKEADYDHTYRTDHLPDHVFADPENRLFPCHTKAATWLSSLYFMNNNPDELTVSTKNNLLKFARYWGIDKDIRHLSSRVKTANEKEEKEDDESDKEENYAFVFDDEGTKKKMLPIVTEAGVKKATDWFVRNRDKLLYDDRYQIAVKIRNRSQQLGLTTPEFIEKQAGYGLCDLDLMTEQILTRCTMIKDADTKASLYDFVKKAHTLNEIEFDVAFLTKTARILDTIDHLENLTDYYGKQLMRPEDFLFKTTFKAANDFVSELVEIGDNSLYNKTDLAKISLDDLQTLFGDEFVERISDFGKIDPDKFAEEIKALPAPEKQDLHKLLCQNGINPIKHKENVLDHDFKKLLAEEYQENK
jgi:hypothetical protein